MSKGAYQQPLPLRSGNLDGAAQFRPPPQTLAPPRRRHPRAPLSRQAHLSSVSSTASGCAAQGAKKRGVGFILQHTCRHLQSAWRTETVTTRAKLSSGTAWSRAIIPVIASRTSAVSYGIARCMVMGKSSTRPRPRHASMWRATSPKMISGGALRSGGGRLKHSNGLPRTCAYLWGALARHHRLCLYPPRSRPRRLPRHLAQSPPPSQRARV